MPVPGFPFGVVRRPAEVAPVTSVAAAATPTPAPSVTDINTYALAYQMMRDAKALPTRKLVCVAGEVVQLVSNAQRLTPMFVRIRAVLENSVGPVFLFIGTDETQTQAKAALDRIGNGGQIEFLLYPGQELWGSYAGDALTTGDILVSTATFDDALIQARRATGQAT